MVLSKSASLLLYYGDNFNRGFGVILSGWASNSNMHLLVPCVLLRKWFRVKLQWVSH